ncbi:MAG: cell wall-binding repeat-containing protein [Clostridia bacterium]|nr:cell wall-binding repeat-containing protein [Clostridia bacterium]
MLKKSISFLLSLIMVFSIFIIIPANEVSAAASGTGRYRISTSGSSLRIRATPSTDAAQVGTVPNGVTVNVTEVSSNWGKTTYNGISGWISLDYATKVDGSAAASTETASILAKLDELRKKFPDGKYWNHYGSSKANPDGWTNTPCPSGHFLNGVQQCNGQCDGFARKLGLDLFSLSTYSWNKTSYNINTVCVGDIIRYNSKHTIMVVGFTSDPNTLIIADCNWDYHCGISWDRSFSTSRYFRTVNWVMHYPGNNFTREVYLNGGATATTTTTTTTRPTTTTTTAAPKITLDYSKYSISAGSDFTLKAKTTPTSLASSVTWSSSNKNVATVDKTGKVKAVKEGTATITAKAGGVSATCKVTVTAKVDIDRIAGEDRVGTAVKVAQYGWGSSGAQNVILANGLSFADTLAGVPLSKALDAPMLLTANDGSLEKDVINQISKLKTKNVYILGGVYVVSESIEKDLIKRGYNVTRLAGTSRYETAIAIADKLKEIKGAPTKVFFANGFKFPDVLSVSPAAALQSSPILYLKENGSLDNSTKKYIENSKFTKAYLIGGKYVIPDKTAQSIKDLGVKSTQRVAGTDRFGTCLAVINTFESSFTGEGFGLATGFAFPDALSGGALSAKLGIPLVLAGESVSAETKQWLNEYNTSRIYVFGGPYAVSDWLMYQYAA